MVGVIPTESLTRVRLQYVGCIRNSYFLHSTCSGFSIFILSSRSAHRWRGETAHCLEKTGINSIISEIERDASDFGAILAETRNSEVDIWHLRSLTHIRVHNYWEHQTRIAFFYFSELGFLCNIRWGAFYTQINRAFNKSWLPSILVLCHAPHSLAVAAVFLWKAVITASCRR